MLEINEVRIKKINKGKFLGFASILIDSSTHTNIKWKNSF